MYIHQQDWAAATRVAEQNDPAHVPDVLVAQAAVCVQRQEFTKAEALYIRAKRPELAMQAYQSASRWKDATRIAKEFLPHKVLDPNPNPHPHPKPDPRRDHDPNPNPNPEPAPEPNPNPSLPGGEPRAGAGRLHAGRERRGERRRPRRAGARTLTLALALTLTLPYP